MLAATIRHDWSRDEIAALFALPFNELLHRAHSVHREHHDPNAVQVSTLLSIKTGGCPEDCGYCPQAARYHTGVKAEKLMPVEAVVAQAQAAKQAGASRFCMGAAWRSPKDRDVTQVAEIVSAVKALGLETRRKRSSRLAWIITTTTLIPRRSFMARSSTPANTRTVWIRWNTCATPA
jgi:biotin synthase